MYQDMGFTIDLIIIIKSMGFTIVHDFTFVIVKMSLFFLWVLEPWLFCLWVKGRAHNK